MSQEYCFFFVIKGSWLRCYSKQNLKYSDFLSFKIIISIINNLCSLFSKYVSVKIYYTITQLYLLTLETFYKIYLGGDEPLLVAGIPVDVAGHQGGNGAALPDDGDSNRGCSRGGARRLLGEHKPTPTPTPTRDGWRGLLTPSRVA
jgi:hypothetical protein